MCGPSVPWDLFVLDVSYVLVLLGGAMVFRARSSPPVVWVWFGMLSVMVGGALFYATYSVQAAAAEAAANTAAVYLRC